MQRCWHCRRETPDGEETCGWCGVWLVAFDPSHVPVPLRGLLKPARRWGIADDGYRSRMVSEATRTELQALLRATGGVDIDRVDAWLSGPEAEAETPSDEYVAVSALLMAAEEARYVLRPPD